jgi:dolichol-phosphate mannosyltransferase
MSVVSICNSIGIFLDKKPKLNISSIDDAYRVDISKALYYFRQAGLTFGEDYLENLLKKYYSRIKRSRKLLSIVVPTYNQQFGIDKFYSRLLPVISYLKQRFDYEIIFVNDFSRDRTYERLEEIARNDPNVKVISFSRNFGNQYAIAAGLEQSRGHIVCIIDDDLQDPPEIILDFIARWYRGYKVVYGQRPERLGISKPFAFFAQTYYVLLSKLSDIEIPRDTGDFRLIDRKVVDCLRKMGEENRYYRGMISWVGFPQTGYLYQRDRRYAGKSNFNFSKYMNFAINGLTSFSDRPLYFSSMLGFAITLMTILMTMSLVAVKIFAPEFTIPGWTSLAVIVLFFGGVQLISMGVLGVYISKIFREVKNRPLYIIEKTLNIEEKSGDQN